MVSGQGVLVHLKCRISEDAGMSTKVIKEIQELIAPNLRKRLFQVSENELLESRVFTVSVPSRIFPKFQFKPPESAFDEWFIAHEFSRIHLFVGLDDRHPLADELAFLDEWPGDEDLVFIGRHVAKVFRDIWDDLFLRGRRITEGNV
jgi:hypothetical protein